MPSPSYLFENLYASAPWNESLSEPLKSFGFDDSKKGWRNLTALASQAKFAELLPDFFPRLLEMVSTSYHADIALHNLERFAEKIQDKEYLYTLLSSSPNLLRALVTLFSGSQILTDTLMSDPSHFDWMNQADILENSRSKDAMMRGFYNMAGEHFATDKTPSLLRKFKKQEYIRIGLRDLMGKTDFRETGADLSNLADVCLQVAYEYAEAQCRKKYGVPMFQDAEGNSRKAEFTILGMGKLGGGELNYSSDIDLIYVYTSSRGDTLPENPAGGSLSISTHEYFTKLALLVTKTINEITPEGNVFRVDLNLRPEGQSGEIVNSLASCEIYYQSWGRTWERQMLLKARVSAGSESLGNEFFSLLEPFVYRRNLDFSVIEEIRSMKDKIDQSLKGKKTGKAHIKLGEGGIREIEFIVQTYQMLFAGKDKSLRIRGTLPLLKALQNRGFISVEDYQSLSEAYIFLRNLENRVQISYGLQTHILPEDRAQLAILAKKMRVEGDGAEQLAERLLELFKKHTRFVGQVFSGLLVEEEKKKAAEVVSGRMADVAHYKENFSKSILEDIPFDDPDRALRFLESLRDGPSFSHPSEKSIQEFYAVLPTILELCRKIPQPNRAVENLVRFVESGGARETYLNLLQNDRKFLELLVILFGSSEFLAATLIKQPGMVDVVMDSESIYRFKSPEKLSSELCKSLNACQNLEEKKIVLRRFKQGEELRIGLRYLIKESDLAGTLTDLATLADVFLEAVYNAALQELSEKSGADCPADFAIIGMGKLGGRELNFGSDLDVVFVYEEPFVANDSGENTISHYVSLSQMICQLTSEMTLAGYAYKIDADLRPEGSGGTLVLSLKGYEDYFGSRARVWEKQAMTRARFVAGNPRLGEKFIKIAHKFVFGEPLEYSSLIEISRLRERMEKELAKESTKGKNVKLGYGGLADIEFSVQILQMMHGSRYPRLRDTNTRSILQALSHHGLVDHHAAEKLDGNYLFLRNLECSLRILIQPFTSNIPEDASKAELARLMGYQGESGGNPVGAMMSEYKSVTEEVRTFYSRLVGALLRKSL